MGVLYYELLPRGVTDIYCQQLKRLAEAIQEHQAISLRLVMLLHNNARPNSANLTKKHYTRVGLGSNSAPTLFT